MQVFFSGFVQCSKFLRWFLEQLAKLPCPVKAPIEGCSVTHSGWFFLAISPHFRLQIWGKNIKPTSGPLNREFVDKSSEWFHFCNWKWGRASEIDHLVYPLLLHTTSCCKHLHCFFLQIWHLASRHVDLFRILEDCLDFREKILWRETAVWIGASILVNECIFCEQCLQSRI